jgi:hypothetical protein
MNRNKKSDAVNTAWDIAIFDKVLRDWSSSQRPISSLEIKLAIRAIVGPNTPVLQSEVSALLRVSYSTRHDPATVAKIGSYFMHYQSKDEVASGKVTYIRYFLPKPITGLDKLKLDFGDACLRVKRLLGISR